MTPPEPSKCSQRTVLEREAEAACPPTAGGKGRRGCSSCQAHARGPAEASVPTCSSRDPESGQWAGSRPVPYLPVSMIVVISVVSFCVNISDLFALKKNAESVTLRASMLQDCYLPCLQQNQYFVVFKPVIYRQQNGGNQRGRGGGTTRKGGHIQGDGRSRDVRRGAHGSSDVLSQGCAGAFEASLLA